MKNIDINNISGRHLTKDELEYVITERCKMFDLDLVQIEIVNNIRDSIITFKCSICGIENTRNSKIILVNKVTRCKECSNKAKQGRFKRLKLTKESLQEEINNYSNYNFTVIEDFVYKNNKQNILIQCEECKNIISTRIDVCKQGRTRCTCKQIRSRLENQVYDILKDLNLKFKKEQTFEDLRYELPLRFDYSISINEEIYLIECDGIQHFYPTFGEESFERTQRSDKLKNEYCLNNNIPLLRIRYDNKVELNELISKFIKLETSTTISKESTLK